MRVPVCRVQVDQQSQQTQANGVHPPVVSDNLCSVYLVIYYSLTGQELDFLEEVMKH